MPRLEFLDLGLDCLEFKDRFGVIRTVYGCSVLGAEEFRMRLEKLHSLLEGAQASTLIELYKSDEYFRHCCDRCLMLNGVDPDWIDHQGRLLESLLFVHDGQPGMLIRLNQPPQDLLEQAHAMGEEGSPASVADLAATLLGLTNDLEKSIKALEQYPAKQVASIVNARAKQIDSQQSDKAKFKEWAKQRRGANAKQQGRKPGKAFNPEALRQVSAPPPTPT